MVVVDPHDHHLRPSWEPAVTSLSSPRFPLTTKILSLAGILGALFLALNTPAADAPEKKGAKLRGTVLDADTGKAVACRLYLQGADGTWWNVKSDDPDGVAVPYKKQRPAPATSVEIHTALTAHPFAVELPPGKYTLTIERGKEYHPLTEMVTVGDKPLDMQFKLRRWIDVAGRGWYSGDTHVHRTLEELPPVVLAEDLNVAFPLIYWVTEAFVSPLKGTRKAERDPGPRPVAVDATHVIYPRNTEYEIFTVNKKSHTLGAFFVLNQQTVLDEGVPPVKDLARRMHKEGALIEMDKHNWPWSMALVPILPVDLYELTNNHIWRTDFAFGDFGPPAPEYMKIERGDKGWTERGWIDFGFQNYYALLNCGFRLRPTAGTASGVHPVPLGFGRVYVYLPDGFKYDAWVRGLNEGRSFVTTGPMLFAQVNGEQPGHTFKNATAGEYHVTGSAESEQPLGRIEIIVNGEAAQTIKPENRKTKAGAYECPLDAKVKLDGSSWLAVRCFEDRPDKRPRFAHTAPFHVEIAGKPLRPRKAEVEFLIQRVEDQIKRSSDVLPKEALDEYREALRAYQDVAKNAR
jgi:hypothetical protein